MNDLPTNRKTRLRAFVTLWIFGMGTSRYFVVRHAIAWLAPVVGYYIGNAFHCPQIGLAIGIVFGAIWLAFGDLYGCHNGFGAFRITVFLLLCAGAWLYAGMLTSPFRLLGLTPVWGFYLLLDAFLVFRDVDGAFVTLIACPHCGRKLSQSTNSQTMTEHAGADRYLQTSFDTFTVSCVCGFRKTF